jgi:hypothetical protein
MRRVWRWLARWCRRHRVDVEMAQHVREYERDQRRYSDDWRDRELMR